MDGDGLPIYPHVLHLVAGAIGNRWQRGGNCHLLRLSMPPLRLPIASSQAGSSSRVVIKHSCSLDACDDTQDIIYCCILILQKNDLCASRSTVGIHTCHPYLPRICLSMLPYKLQKHIHAQGSRQHSRFPGDG